jgi:hypothetical protein
LEAVAALFMKGYLAEMNTRPQTIGYGSTDPVGLAAWMLDHDTDSYEKISHAFLDGQPAGNLTQGQDRRQPHAVLADQHRHLGRAAVLGERTKHRCCPCVGAEAPELSLPVAFTTFPDEIFQAPRSWAEKVYPNLTYFNEAERGGHFAAWEQPQLFSEELRAAFRPLR